MNLKISSLVLLACTSTLWAQNDPDSPTSNNDQIYVLPAPGPVVIDGKDDDWDLSGGVWSYNDPTLVKKYSLWTHMMWDDKGVYLLGRFHDLSPMKNATRGKDFMQSWKADAMQTRVIFDDKTPDEHQMHINLFYSSSESQPYMIVKHGGFKSAPPYDGTGPDRPDQQEKYGTSMEAKGGKIAFQPWADGQGYNMEAFWPWSYLRTSGQPLKAGESFIFGVEAMWGNSDGTTMIHRLVENLKNDQVNRIFFFRARDGWGRAIISEKGKIGYTESQKQLQAARLKNFINYDTVGPVAISYELPEERDVTIAIDNKDGVRVRNLIGQFPRAKGKNTDYWDGLDDAGNAVPPGEYTVQIVDHLPIQLKLFNSLYNAATPPWPTDNGRKIWGSNHGFPTTAASRGDVTLLGFTGTEGASGLMRIDANGLIQWNDFYELLDVTLDDKYAYAFSRDSWIKKTVMRRYDVNTGKIALFEDAEKSPNSFLPIEPNQVTDGTIAKSGGKIYVFVRGNKLYRMHPDTGAIEAQMEVPGLIALDDRDDVLRGLFEDGTIQELTPDGQKKSVFLTVKDLKDPVRFAISQDNKRIAISDRATNQVLIYDTTGKLIQTIGKPYAAVDGKRPAGKFIDTDLIKPNGLDFDSKGRLWLAEAEDSNRRITCWSPEGKLENQYWGAADYGALAGFPLTNDSTKFIAHGVEFLLDPALDIMNRPSQEKPLMFHPDLSKTRGLVYKYQDHEYAVSVPGLNKQEYVLIAKRNQDGIFKTVVRIEYGDARGKTPTPNSVWTDLNENGQVDPGEKVEGFAGNRHYWSNGWMRPDMTFITPDQKVYPLKELSATGVPIYDFSKPQTLPNSFPPNFSPNRSGTIAMDQAGNVSDGINFATTDGRKGSYPNPFGRHDAPAARRGLLIAPFRTNGVVENIPGIGSMTAIGGDRGEWFLMSMDGLYISSLLQDSKGDVTLNENFVGQESFGGFMWKDEKNRVLVQLGGSSYRLMEMTGLDSIRRNTQKLSLSSAQIAEGIKQAQAKAAASPKEPAALKIARVEKVPIEPVSPDSRSQESLIETAETALIQESGDPSRWFRVALAQDGKNLAISWLVNDSSPWKNGEGKFTHAFIGGDAVDLQLNLPGRGPVRILTAPIAGKNTVIYWQKKADKKDNPTTYVVANNESNAQNFDVVKILDKAKAVSTVGARGYSVLVTIPLSELGIDSVEAGEIKGLAGVIFSDPSGTNRASRLYWHDKGTGLVSDVPSEARLEPKNWGPIQIAK
ncbi:hypothetical protein FGG08_007387 [Glutinoglossum americanum]|uniref:FlgD/Vpr Ig-like domain-containing protein n=1 Tax=Glutinoglossum americanum TaxID=1670608 RepID=A0A9P8HZE8_9PEZI|nr:hypothetical protein FGG08_007387 [Glutinoglossum americanum]